MILFTNGPFKKPYSECLRLWVPRCNDYKWVITFGQDHVLCKDLETNLYDVKGDSLVLTNKNPVWSQRTIAYWDSPEQALDALTQALKQDPNLFSFDFLFNDPQNIENRNRYLNQK